MDRLETLRLFVRIVDTGAFSRAAAELGIGQPAASRAIRELEERLGTGLLHRSTRRVAPSEAGERVYRHAAALLAAHDAMLEAVAGETAALSGPIRIACSLAFAKAVLSGIVASFAARHPAVRIDLAVSDMRVDLIEQGIDVAFRLGDLADSGMMGRRLRVYRRILVAAPPLLAAHPPLTGPAALARLPLIGFAGTPAARQWRLERGADRHLLAFEPALSCSNGDIVVDLASAGRGVALVADFAASPAIAAGSLVRVLPEWEGPALALHALWPAQHTVTQRVRSLIDFVAEQLV